MKSKLLSFFKPAAPAKPVSPLGEQIERARVLHQQGQIEAAATLYGEILAAHPDSAEAHYRCANVLKDQGALQGAVSGYDKAIALRPDFAHAFCNRAVVLGQMRMMPEAVASYDRAIALDPTDALARYNRGMLLNGMGQKDAALESFNDAIACNAEFVPAHFARAALLQERKQWAAALASYDRAIALNAGDAAAYYNRGTILKELERWPDALASYDRAIALNGEFALAHAARAETLQQLNRLPEALDSYNKAIELSPGEATHYDARGVLLHKMGLFDAALDSYNQAIATNPNYPQAYFNRAAALEKLRDFAGALASYNLALAKKPGFADFHFNLALTSLKVGDYVNGWAHYEWRWRTDNGPILLKKREFSQPLWLGGDDIAGRTILLYGEQGLGDSLQFCRYCEMVAGLGARVILEVPRPLVSVCATLRGVTEVIPYGEPLPELDVQCPLMSLPLACKTTLETIPSPGKYINSDPLKVAAWQERLGAPTRPRIGLTWSGSQAARMHSERCFPLEMLVPNLPDNFQYFCLQTEITEVDRKTLAENAKIRQFDGELRDFSDTAALCECLDLVISMDTSVVHLNGALGKKTWVLLPFDNDWRWLIDRDDSPWYRTVRVFRQKSRGDWNDVFERVAAQLHREFANPDNTLS
jgi:tetratricopeptide (TPR) repeat protein